MSAPRTRRVERLRRSSEFALQEQRLALQDAARARDAVAHRRDRIRTQVDQWSGRLQEILRSPAIGAERLQWTSDWLDVGLRHLQSAGERVREADQGVADAQGRVGRARQKVRSIENRLEDLRAEERMEQERQAMLEIDDLTLGRWGAP